MNLHHVELFYHVAKHGGISRAVRHMPYGIQQPAVSSQILLLEQDLGVKLFDLLHEADASREPRIAVAPIPGNGLAAAIRDRLKKAAAPRSSPAPGSSS